MKNIERWVTIAGFENYEVSNKGRVISKERIQKYIRANNKEVLHKLKRKYMKQQTGRDGYFSCCLVIMEGKKAYRIAVHRLVALNFIENEYNYPYVNHKDGNKLNNNLINLEWCSPQQNSDHAYEMGLGAIGERCSLAKMTSEQVYRIKELLRDGVSRLEIAKMYNVTKHIIRHIAVGESWRHIQLKPETSNV